jgi:hypothetical protein
MVGESSVLSAAQRRLLQAGPEPAFVEGNFGRFLLAADIARPSLRFRWGGRLKARAGRSLGVSVRPESLDELGELMATTRAR